MPRRARRPAEGRRHRLSPDRLTRTKMSKPFLGVGAQFPLALTAPVAGPNNPRPGQLARAEYEESVRQAILVILGTAKGERVMRPDFGCGIHDLVFANVSATTIGRVTHDVREALLRLEPRI